MLSNDNSLKFRAGQRDENIIDRIRYLLSQLVDTASDVKLLNDEIVALDQDLANSVTSKKSVKRPNKKEWHDKSCRSAKRESNRANRNASKDPDSLFLREQIFFQEKGVTSCQKTKKATLPKAKSRGCTTAEWLRSSRVTKNT